VVDLLFAEGLADPDLVFGTTGTPPAILSLGSAALLAPPVLAGVLVAGAIPIGSAASLPAIILPIAITAVPILTSSAVLSDALAALSIDYDNAVNRAPFRWAKSSFQSAAARADRWHLPHHATHMSQHDAGDRMAAAQTLRASVRPGWQVLDGALRPSMALAWRAASPLAARMEESFAQLFSRLRPSLIASFSGASPLTMTASTRWSDLQRTRRPLLDSPWGTGHLLSMALVAPFHVGTAASLFMGLPWESGRHPLPGRSPRITPPAVPPPYDPGTDLVFGDGHVRHVAKVIIPVLRSYIVVNDVTLVRTEGSLSLPAFSLSVSIDADSWVWGWQASLPATALDDVLPSGPGAPVEFAATINGVNFLLLGEKVTRDRRFAQARITVSGRGIAAELGDPYAPIVSRNNDADRTAQQLMADALTVNGVGIGWGLDWHLTDWLVPAGVWSHTGTHIEAVNRIAEAAGGYVQASRNSQTLRILPRYPVAPWDWSGVDPDFSLPSAATTRESVEWLEKPAYNAVYISGEGAGVLAQVQRAATAGDRPAQMVTDALTTHADAARQRGLAILADTGRQQLLTLETPVLSGVGIYPVGSFVQFADDSNSRLGIVRSVSVNAAFPTVRQTIEIECHG
jgi:hypothetical protein